MFYTKLQKHRDLGILIIRVGMGLGFLYFHGWSKLTAGVEGWTRMGGSMERLGITFGEPFWGFMIAFAESIGALMIAVGFLVAPMSLLLAIGMFVAWTGHIASGQGTPAHAFKNMMVFIGLVFVGGGRYSIDAWLASRMQDD